MTVGAVYGEYMLRIELGYAYGELHLPQRQLDGRGHIRGLGWGSVLHMLSMYNYGVLMRQGCVWDVWRICLP